MMSSQQLVRTIRLAVVTRRVLHRARYELPKTRTTWLQMSKVIETQECPSISKTISGWKPL
jgi:hypothetical protein